MDEIGALFAGHVAFPFIEAIGWEKTATAADGVFETGFFINGFAPRIDQGARAYFFGPAWNKAPAHQIKMALMIKAVSHNANWTAGCYILARRKFGSFEIFKQSSCFVGAFPKTIETTHEVTLATWLK